MRQFKGWILTVKSHNDCEVKGIHRWKRLPPSFRNSRSWAIPFCLAVKWGFSTTSFIFAKLKKKSLSNLAYIPSTRPTEIDPGWAPRYWEGEEKVPLQTRFSRLRSIHDYLSKSGRMTPGSEFSRDHQVLLCRPKRLIFTLASTASDTRCSKCPLDQVARSQRTGNVFSIKGMCGTYSCRLRTCVPRAPSLNQKPVRLSIMFCTASSSPCLPTLFSQPELQ